MDGESMGKALGDFIKGLYWLVGGLAVTVVVLIGIIIWLVIK
jgi:hypothetical protein